MRTVLFVILLLTGYSYTASAQYDTRYRYGKKYKPHVADSTDEDDDDEMEMDDDGSMHNAMHMAPMSHAFSLSLPMTRNGSGTSWVPDATPMYGYMLHKEGWMFMFHGDVFARFNQQDVFKSGSRGSGQLDAPSMLMAMGQHRVGKAGLFHFNIMLSADALIAGGNGYPLLFQTGESWKGQPLVDRQHPHDLFSELSVSYAYSFSQKADAFVYLGYPGEPALGPVTFMHRPSGMFNPDAPIGHHWADATHISFGVATLGFRYGLFKLEGSSFTGREPDEQRYGFDRPRFDSWSGRLSYNPTKHWALQVSHGYIKSPEALYPAENINRTTASATWVYALSKNKYATATALVGQNAIKGHDASNTALLEGTYKYKKLAVYGRYEWVQKSREELNLPILTYARDEQYNINMLTVGTSYDLYTYSRITVAAGAQASVYMSDAALNKLYGTIPMSAEIYLHFYPQLMR